LRERVFALADAGQRVGEIAAALRLSVSYVSKALSRWQRTGVRTALPQCSHRVAKLRDLHEAIRARVAADPDTTIADLRTWLQTNHQVTVSVGVIWRTLKQLNLTLKKSHCGRRNRIARMLPQPASDGVTDSPPSIQPHWCLSMRPRPRPT
jgi:transposase